MSDRNDNNTATLHWVGTTGLSFTEDSPVIELDLPKERKRIRYDRYCRACGKAYQTYDKKQKFCKRIECVRDRRRKYQAKYRRDPQKEAKRKQISKEYSRRRRVIEKAVDYINDTDNKREIEEQIEAGKKALRLEAEMTKHGFEWGKIKAERTLEKVPKINTDVSKFK